MSQPFRSVAPTSVVRPLALALFALTLLAPAARAASLDSLAWMAGTWVGESEGLRMEEHWTAPEGGLMVAMHRDVRGGRAISFEFLRIEAHGDTLVYVALPRGRHETPFPLKELGAKRVVFENPTHDYPQRILYWQSRPGTLSARTEGTLNGKEEHEEWTWKRGESGH
jgi:hypothetical protein